MEPSMMEQSMNMPYETKVDSYDYDTFSRFTNDKKEFKHGADGDIYISTDCSSWKDVLLNNMKLSDFIDSEALVPPETLTFPNFGTREKKKNRKETVGNYIDSCELCEGSLETGTFRFHCGVDKYLICSDCNKYAKRELTKKYCIYCHQNPPEHYNMFIDGRYKEYLVSPYKEMMCVHCILYRFGDYALTDIPNQGVVQDEDYHSDEEHYPIVQQDDDFEYEEEICISCRGESSGGGICYWCRVDWMMM